MLVKLEFPPSPEYPDGKQVWLDAESVDRLEGDTDWSKKKTTIFLKRNPTEPFVVLKKSLPDVAHAINQGLMGDVLRDLVNEVQKLVGELAMRRSGE